VCAGTCVLDFAQAQHASARRHAEADPELEGISASGVGSAREKHLFLPFSAEMLLAYCRYVIASSNQTLG